MPGPKARHSLYVRDGGQPRRPQTGHAPMPWLCRTFSATRICSSRLAPDGDPDPPLARQVLEVNCSPPEKPLPVLIDQLPPDSHCAMASQFTLYALWTGGGGGASGAGGGGTFGSKPTGAGAGASGAGGGGASGTASAGGTFGSMPIGSAVAVAAGAVTNVPEIAARMSVLRTFFKFLPFAVRARQSKPTGVG